MFALALALVHCSFLVRTDGLEGLPVTLEAGVGRSDEVDGSTDDDARRFGDSDVGPADGSGKDAAAADAAAPCPAGTSCFDFEGDTSALEVKGTCEISSSVAHHGTHSAHCKGSTSSYFSVKPSFAPAPPLAFRAWVRGIPPATSAPSVGYVGFMSTTLEIPLMVAGDGNLGSYDLFWCSSHACGWIPSKVLDGSPSWVCVEAVFAAPRELSYFIDGSQVDFTRTDASLGNDPLEFRWGLPFIQGGSEVREAYVDDVVIGTSRIGCN